MNIALDVATQIADALDAAMESLREITRGVFPAQLARSGLPTALQSLFTRAGGTRSLVADEHEMGNNLARILRAAAGLALWTVSIEARLVYLQVIAHEDFTSRASRQQMRTVVPPAKRGDIFDRKGRLLAYSVDADTIYAVGDKLGTPTYTPDFARCFLNLIESGVFGLYHMACGGDGSRYDVTTGR